MERISVKDCGVINKHFWKWHYFNSCSSCFVTLSVSCQECEKVSTIWLAEKNISPITLDDLNVARFIVTQAAFLWMTRMGQKSKGACDKSSVGKSLICFFFQNFGQYTELLHPNVSNMPQHNYFWPAVRQKQLNFLLYGPDPPYILDDQSNNNTDFTYLLVWSLSF